MVVTNGKIKNYHWRNEWQDKKLPLAFHFENNSNYLLIRLLIGPDENQPIRKRIHQLSQENPTFFKRSRWAEKWITIYQKQILSQRDYEDADVEKLMKKMQESWDKFMQNDFPNIENIISTNLNHIIPEGAPVNP